MDNVPSYYLIMTKIYLPKAIIALVLMLGFWIAGRVAKHAVLKVATKINSNRSYVLSLLAQAIFIALLLMGAITALGTLGINVMGLVAGLGLTGFALSFALKDYVSNVLAGILILLYQPFRHDDTITVAKFSGKVIAIDLRYTTLQGKAEKVLVPNSTLLTQPVTIHEVAAE